MSTIRESPTGYCIHMFDGSVWLTKDLEVTHDYSARGVWPTLGDAEKAMAEALTK